MLVILRAVLLTIRGLKMTMNQFVALCVERTIEPELALESESVRDAIRARDIELLISILDNEF